jgi:hypothetical protein
MVKKAVSTSGNGLTQRDMLIKTMNAVKEIDDKLNTVIVSHGERLVGVERDLKTAIDRSAEDRRWATTILLSLCGTWILAMIGMLSACIESRGNHAPTFTPALVSETKQAPTSTDVSTPTITPTWTLTSTPISTLDTGTEEISTIEPDANSTPTQIASLPTQSIIEKTPLGGNQWPPSADYWQALPDGVKFITYGVVNVRNCTSKSCSIIDRYGGGVSVDVYAIWHVYGKSEKWLCLTPDLQYDKETACFRAMAWVYNDQELGRLDWPD